MKASQDICVVLVASAEGWLKDFVVRMRRLHLVTRKMSTA